MIIADLRQSYVCMNRASSAMAALGETGGCSAGRLDGLNSEEGEAVSVLGPVQNIKQYEEGLPTDLEELRKMKRQLLQEDATFGFAYRVCSPYHFLIFSRMLAANSQRRALNFL